MPKKIRISGDIGFDVTSEQIISQLDAAAGADLDIEIASPGGSVFTGIELFNAFRAYRAAHPAAQIMITISGLAASMASYIAAVDVADLVVAYDNSVGMYHFPWNVTVGDFRAMRQNADFLEGLSLLMADAYSKRSGKSKGDTMTFLGAESWLFGQQIKDAGFCDEIIPAPADDQTTDAAAAISAAKLKYQAMQARAKTRQEAPERVAAVMRQVLPAAPTQEPKKSNISANPVVDGAHDSITPVRGKKGPMDLEQLKKDHPEVYALAVAAGVKQEQDRVAALSAMKKDKRFEKIAAVQAVLDECIEKGKSTHEANALIMATLASNGVQAAIESPGELVVGSVDTPTGEQPQGAEGKSEPAPWKPGQAEEV